MKQRVYIDTSVVGGYYDVEFEEYTRPLFDKIKQGKIIIIYSDLLEKELQDAPERVKEVIKEIPMEFVENIKISDESIELAQK